MDSSNLHHRTDCIICKKRIYHPPIGEMSFSGNGVEFWGTRKEGKVFKFTSFETGVHYLLLPEDSKYVVATCREYWALHLDFEYIYKMAVDTRNGGVVH